VVPGADLVVTSPRVDLNTGYRFTLNEYAQSDVQDSQDHDAHLDLSYRLSRRLVFKAGDHFLSTSDPADVEIPERVGRISNEARGEIRYVTPGEDLDLGIRYTNTFTEYDATLDALSYYNNKVAVTSRFNVSSQFRFLPKSTATASFEYGRTDFNEAEPPAVSNSDSQAIFLSAGLTSQFSRKFSASARIGGTLLYFDTGPDESTVVGGLDLQLQPAERLTFLLGYEYSSQISTFTNYHDDHVARVEARWKFARKFEAMEAFQVSYLDFSPPNVLPNGETRRDWVYQNLFRVSYAVVEWGKLRVEYQYDRRDSNAVTTIGAASGDFTKHRATLGFDVYY
jgi:opacity protein-like surface antigen